MGVFIFLLVIGVGGITAFRLLAPEMYVQIDRSRFRFPWERTKLIPDAFVAVPIKAQEFEEDFAAVVVDVPKDDQKIEFLLYEKNKLLNRLTTELEAERAHRKEFEKVKDIMADEIQRLKNQVREFKNNKESSHA